MHAADSVPLTLPGAVTLRIDRAPGSGSACNAIDLLGHALRNPAETTGKPDDSDEPPLAGAAVRQLLPSPHPDAAPDVA
ncbi:hypothetical protein ABZ424_21610 [Streptomyces sp. NPDC005790]|uniref:hypothetical protein n=1 Tax=Streptomyces sp. NPDC005790 TaxID=3154777 RepID=UPI0034027687